MRRIGRINPMRNKQTTTQLGFTLLELLVVISIIGMLDSMFVDNEWVHVLIVRDSPS